MPTKRAALRISVKPLKTAAKALASRAKRGFSGARKALPKLLKTAAKKLAGKAKRAPLTASAIVKELGIWNGLSVTVGIHAKDGTATEEGGLSVAEIMTIHEFGSPSRNIPQRSWLRAWFDESAGTNAAFISSLTQQIAKGNLTAMQAAKRLGVVCVGNIQRRWASGANWEASKVDGRKIRLIDTGQGRASVTFAVHQKGVAL